MIDIEMIVQKYAKALYEGKSGLAAAILRGYSEQAEAIAREAKDKLADWKDQAFDEARDDWDLEEEYGISGPFRDCN